MSIKPIYSITPFTLLDFPERVAAILWFAGCNFRCPYCYNPDIVFSKGGVTEKDALEFLKKRKGLLEGVVLSGGEATIYSGLKSFVQKIKELGFLVKLDTNGSNPSQLKEMLDGGLLDYVALDFKAPKEKFTDIAKQNSYNALLESIKAVHGADVKYEVRTTYHSLLLDENDIQKIVAELQKIGYKNFFYIQNYVKTATTIEPLPESKTLSNTSLLDSCTIRPL